jgi:hypothetical protein
MYFIIFLNTIWKPSSRAGGKALELPFWGKEAGLPLGLERLGISIRTRSQ